MQLTLRPYLTAGVVVASAGFIAVIPVGPPTPDIQIRAVQQVDQDFPIVTVTDLFNDTVTNFQGLGQEISDSPMPVLDQIMTNWAGYGSDLSTAFQDAGSNLATVGQQISTDLSNAFTNLSQPDGLDDAVVNIWNDLLSTPQAVFAPLINALSSVAGSIASNVGTVLSDPTWSQELLTAGLYPLNAAVNAVAGVGQDIVNAVSSGDYTTALNDLLDAPSTIADAFLNGYPDDLLEQPTALAAPATELAAAPATELAAAQLQAGVDGLTGLRELAGLPGGGDLEGFLQALDPEWGLLTNEDVFNTASDCASDCAVAEPTGTVADGGVVERLAHGTFENLLQARAAITEDVTPAQEVAQADASAQPDMAAAAPAPSGSEGSDQMAVLAADPTMTLLNGATTMTGVTAAVSAALTTALADFNVLFNAIEADFGALFEVGNVSDIPVLLDADFMDLGGLIVGFF